MATKLVWCVVTVCAVVFVSMASADLLLDMSRVAARSSSPSCRQRILVIPQALTVSGTTRSRMCSIAKNSFFQQTMRSYACSTITLANLKTAICGSNDRTPVARIPAYAFAVNREADSLSGICSFTFKQLSGSLYFIYSQRQSCLAMQSDIFRRSFTSAGICTSSEYNRMERIICQFKEETTEKPTPFPTTRTTTEKPTPFPTIPTTPVPLPTELVTSALPPSTNDLQFRIRVFTESCGAARETAASWVRGKSAQYLCEWMGTENERRMLSMGCSRAAFGTLRSFVCEQSNRPRDPTKNPFETRTPFPTESPVTDGPRVGRTDLDSKLRDVAQTMSASCRAFVYGTSFQIQGQTTEQTCSTFASSSFRQYVTSNGRRCSNAEYEQLKDAVCGASMHALAFSLALVCMLAHFFSKA